MNSKTELSSRVLSYVEYFLHESVHNYGEDFPIGELLKLVRISMDEVNHVA